MGFLKLFRRTRSPVALPRITPAVATRVWEEPRHDLAGGGGLAEFREVHQAWRFCATMQLRTPLRILERHGELHTGRAAAPPMVADEPWQGVWVPVSRTFRELGLNIDEPAPGAMASSIGLIPADGGAFLPFLKSVRSVVEAEGSSAERRQRLKTVLGEPAAASIVRKLGGRTVVLEQLFPPYLSTITGLSPKAIAELKAHRLTSAHAIASATDAELLAISGIGQVKLAVLRASSEAAGRSADVYVEGGSASR